ncbi:MAG TPA: hypothetical protein HA367_01270 [Candidatus Methanofastidiosum sp.]|nr:hypothetical protein [Methanofastidiosum sp.]
MSSQLMTVVQYLLASSLIIPPLIEFITHKVKGGWKLGLMATVSLGISVWQSYTQGAFIGVVWTDIPMVIGLASGLLMLMSNNWNTMFKKFMNPFLDK